MRSIAPEIWAAIRVQYETTERSNREIGADYDIGSSVVWHRAKADGWLRPGETRALQQGDEAKLLARLYRTFELQLADLEKRFVAAENGVDEKDARTLGVLARTLEVLAKLRDPKEDEGDAEIDLDQLRAKLAARLSGIPVAGDDAARPLGGGDRPPAA